MRSRNPNYGRARDVARGRVSPRRAGSRGVTVLDGGGNEVHPVTDIRFDGATVTDGDDGLAIVNFGGGTGTGGTGGGGGATGGGGVVGGTVVGSVGSPVPMLNNAGRDLAAGEVVVVDETADDAVTTTTTEGDTRIAGVVQADILADAIGPVLFNGFTGAVVTTGAVTRGYYLETSAVAGAAQAVADRTAGTFAVVTDEADVAPIVESATVTESAGAVTSLAIDLPLTSVPAGRVLFLVLFRDPGVTTAVTLTGWTRVGSTSGFWYYYRVATGTDPATATWSTASAAVAIAAILDRRVDAADIVESQAFDATTAAAALSGLSSAPRLAIAGVQADVATPGGGFVRFGGLFTNVNVSGITAAPEGAWPTLGGRPFYVGGKTYIGWTNDAGGQKAGSYDNATGVLTTGVFRANGSEAVDQHNQPALLRRASDGKLVGVGCGHNAASIHRRISTNADDVTAWGTDTDIISQLGATRCTYPALFQLLDEASDPIYLFYRDNDGVYNWETSKSTDGGVTWSAFTNLFWATRSYGQCVKASESRLDFACTDGSYAEDHASLYHFYYEGGSYFKSDGTLIVDTPPIAFANMTKVYDGATAGARAPGDMAVLGGDIVIVFPVQTGTPTGHIGEDEDYLYARWDGASWNVETVAADVGGTELDYTEGMLSVDPADLDHLVVSKRGPGGTGTWRIWDYVTADDGATWTATRITETGDDDIYPEFVRDHDPGLEYVWLKGTFTDESVFDAAIYGYGAFDVVAGTLAGKYIGSDAAVTSPFAGAGQELDAIFAINLADDARPSALLYGPDLATDSGSSATYAWQPLFDSGTGTAILDSGTGNPIMAFAPV